METRRYDPDRDSSSLWGLKERFEGELGGLGGDEKADTYDDKLDEDYRERYLDWAAWCVEHDSKCIAVADAEGKELAGYVFVLPEELSMIWDAGVVNELYVGEAHRGSGLVDDLLDAAFACVEAQDLPLDRVALDVDPDNGPANGVYQRHGFEPWGELLMREH
ncbi:GNAT family N-acetyltransferase [Halococcus sp. IIIV-5B]|uniref:GNAT family N-acetyltransferase n=1 Tax=Halococcus sp. IIIV-5B TaxID=2321230 RepID=UPI000E752220|nr:GNAT family N-acetyltransferase [Halococcus sp. IIIV-5B]RJT06138.1 GNAT family N-acetyltransferase [Halococcus sp. IIIV-5B]